MSALHSPLDPSSPLAHCHCHPHPKDAEGVQGNGSEPTGLTGGAGICAGACQTQPPLLKSGPHIPAWASRRAGGTGNQDWVLPLTRLPCWAEVGVVSSGCSTCSHTVGGERRVRRTIRRSLPPSVPYLTPPLRPQIGTKMRGGAICPDGVLAQLPDHLPIMLILWGRPGLGLTAGG